MTRWARSHLPNNYTVEHSNSDEDTSIMVGVERTNLYLVEGEEYTTLIVQSTHTLCIHVHVRDVPSCHCMYLYKSCTLYNHVCVNTCIGVPHVIERMYFLPFWYMQIYHTCIILTVLLYSDLQHVHSTISHSTYWKCRENIVFVKLLRRGSSEQCNLCTCIQAQYNSQF